jgi:hypothetical protein
MNRMILLVMGLALVGCRADDEVKQGVQGEFCEGADSDCRQGYICDRGYCRLLSIDGTDCRSMCARIASCGVVDEGCVDDCQSTIAGDCGSVLPCAWSDNAVDAFGNCIVNTLTCDEIGAGEGPQLCYQELDLPTDRKGNCDQFIAVMENCGAGDTEVLLNRCYQLARTATDLSFTRTNACSELVSEGLCFETAECLNSIFLLQPPLQINSPTNNLDGRNNVSE